MKIDAVLTPNTFTHDTGHEARLLVSLTAPAPSDGADAPVPSIVARPLTTAPLSLGTERCDSRPTYAADVEVMVTALAGHKIERIVSDERRPREREGHRHRKVALHPRRTASRPCCSRPRWLMASWPG